MHFCDLLLNWWICLERDWSTDLSKGEDTDVELFLASEVNKVFELFSVVVGVVEVDQLF
jgi:hypothetical protein